MAQAQVKAWIDGEVLTAADLNAMNTNVLNNGLAVVSPLTGDLEAGRQSVLDVRALRFVDSAAEPEDDGYLIRNALQLQAYDGARVQYARGISDYLFPETAVPTTGTTQESLNADALLPAGVIDRSDWLLEYDVAYSVAANGNQKLALVVIDDGTITQTIALVNTTASGVTIRSRVWIWRLSATEQSYLAVTRFTGGVQIAASDMVLDEAATWLLSFEGTTPSAAGDLSYQHSILTISR